MRGSVLVALTALLAGSASLAQNPVPVDTGSQPPRPTPAEADSGSLINFGDEERRMTVPVSIAANGPYNFIIDTGAERTVISRQLANQLKLQPGRSVRVTAMANIATVDTAMIPSLSVSRIKTTAIEAPMLEYANLGAVGMLGIDAIQGHTVTIDFDRNEMTLKPSRRRLQRIDQDDVVIRAKNLYGQLIVTDAHYRGKRISVVIDTGSQITVANSAFRKMLKKPPKQLSSVSLLSATGAWLSAEYGVIDRIEIGGIGFQQVPLAFADAKPFARFDLSNTPAILLGMDSLRMFRKVQIDFSNRQVLFTLPRNTRPTDASITGF